MAQASKLENTQQASKAIIRLITNEWDNYDKNSPHFYHRDLSGTIRYPFLPTYSGMTQSPEFSLKFFGYLGGCFLSLLI